VSQQSGLVEQFGKYQIFKKIGHGGMAEVFLANASDTPPGTPPIVIKRMHHELEKDRDAVDLFLTEADVTLMLDHPNVIRVYDSGEVGGRYFIAMEYVHGKTLEQLIDRFHQKRLAMDPDIAVHILLEVLSGLDYVHMAKTPNGRLLGIVHRDITPSNVFVSATGSVKLGDFGVAKLVGVEGWTMAGSIKGKLGYLSPEQIGGEPPSPHIDLWAAAVILFELLANERLFVGDNELEVMLRIKAAKVPDLRKVNKAAPKPLEKILCRALHKKQRKRYATAHEFLEDLGQYRAKYGKTYTPLEVVNYLTTTLA
jgi:eukaryotic-like serine/threonine-protein kinase